MKGELILTDGYNYEETTIALNPSYYDFTLLINIDGYSSLEEQLKNKELIEECIEEYIKNEDINSNWYTESELEYIKNNQDTILDNIEYIKFQFTETNIREYINKNPKILTKK